MRINSSPKLDKLLITCTATHMQLPGKQSVQEIQSAQDRDNAIILMHVTVYCNIPTNITTNDKTNIHLHKHGIYIQFANSANQTTF